MKDKHCRRTHNWGRASAVLVLGMVLIVAALSWIFERWGFRPQGQALIITGAIMAFVPSLLWLLFFYLQDRAEPEPTGYVLSVYALGALVYGGLLHPLINNVFTVSRWQDATPFTYFTATFLVTAMLQEFFKYASVRYTVFFSREFDEPLDGIVYCTAAGLGLSAMLNFFYVLDHQGVNLSYGLSRMFINSLAHACFAAVTGYFLGLTRFRPCQVKVTLGLLMAVLCNGCFFFLLEKVSYVGFNISITNGLALAAVFCGALLAIIFNLIHKAQVDPDAWRCEPEGTT